MNTDNGLLTVKNLVKHFDISGGLLDQLAMEKGRIVGVDVEIRPHNRQAIEAHELFPFITLIEGDSVADDIVQCVREQVSENDDVLVIGKAVQDDDLAVLKVAVESGLANLSSKVANYLSAEKEHHQKSKKKVRSLTRQVRDMEAETTSLRGEIKTKQDLAVKDSLTGAYNRAGYEERITEEFARRQRVSSPLSLVFADCNKFKKINDTFGHSAGDVVLVKVAETLKNRARTSDVVARYGGDEFVVLLPDTPLDGAEIFAKDACKKILDAGFNNNGQPLDVSISCGITEVREDDTPITALQRADEAMYQAKKQSGEKVFVSG